MDLFFIEKYYFVQLMCQILMDFGENVKMALKSKNGSMGPFSLYKHLDIKTQQYCKMEHEIL